MQAINLILGLLSQPKIKRGEPQVVKCLEP